MLFTPLACSSCFSVGNWSFCPCSELGWQGLCKRSVEVVMLLQRQWCGRVKRLGSVELQAVHSNVIVTE
jgi:hypothetical protein